MAWTSETQRSQGFLRHVSSPVANLGFQKPSPRIVSGPVEDQKGTHSLVDMVRQATP